MSVLLIEDEERIADFVGAGLAARGMEVRVCHDGNAGFDQARGGACDAIVLDLMPPGRDGLSVLAGLRAEGVTTAVIVLTARNELGDGTEGLDRDRQLRQRARRLPYPLQARHWRLTWPRCWG